MFSRCNLKASHSSGFFFKQLTRSRALEKGISRVLRVVRQFEKNPSCIKRVENEGVEVEKCSHRINFTGFFSSTTEKVDYLY